MYIVRLIHWKPEEAETQIETLTSAGYQVASEPMSPAVLRGIRENPPDALLIDLNRLPSQGRDMALNLRKTKATRNVPIIFIDGDPGKVAKIKGLLPDAIYTTWDELPGTLPEAIENPPADPVVPESIMAAYSGTPLPKKLGIRKGSTVALIDAPQGFEDVLDDLPDDITFVREFNNDCDVTLWFNTSEERLQRQVGPVGEIAGDGKLWIIWPKKSSDIESDLTQIVVRKVGLESGLVDYKIAAIDKTWSGLCFTKRKVK
ncbi:MAG: hypothetical protein U9R58_14950 [Chloroflexota bacterium]|nr:hypothetical protein [Chloroflexota bacterium]